MENDDDEIKDNGDNDDVDIIDKWKISDVFMNKQNNIVKRNRKKFVVFFSFCFVF